MYFCHLKKYIYILCFFAFTSCDDGVQDRSLSTFSGKPIDISKVLDYVGETPTIPESYFIAEFYINNSKPNESIPYLDLIIESDDELVKEAKYAKVKALLMLKKPLKSKTILEGFPASNRNEVAFLEGMLMCDFYLSEWTAKTSYYYDVLIEKYPSSEVFRYLDVLHDLSLGDTTKAIDELKSLLSKSNDQLDLQIMYLDLSCCSDSISKIVLSDLIDSNIGDKHVQRFYIKNLIEEEELDSARSENIKYNALDLVSNKQLIESLIKKRSIQTQEYLDFLIKKEKLSSFDQLRYQADVFYFLNKQYYKARKTYYEALNINSEDKYVQSQISKLNWRINQMATQTVADTITN